MKRSRTAPIPGATRTPPTNREPLEFSTGEDPGNGDRTIEFVLSDDHNPTLDSAPVSRAVKVPPVNDAPTVTTTSDALEWTSGATKIDPGVAVADVDSTLLTGATVSIADALRSVTYDNPENAPTPGTRTVTFKVTDGHLESTRAMRHIAASSSV